MATRNWSDINQTIIDTKYDLSGNTITNKEVAELLKDWDVTDPDDIKGIADAGYYMAMRAALGNILSADQDWNADSMIQRFNMVESDSVKSKFMTLLQSVFSTLITEPVRTEVVRLHARGLTTSRVIDVLCGKDERIENISGFTWIARRNESRNRNVIKKFLMPRIAYLKKGAPNFPEKYQDVWCESRSEYVKDIEDLPMVTTREHIAALNILYEDMVTAFDGAVEAREKVAYSNAIVKIIGGLHVLSSQGGTALPHAHQPPAIPS